MTVFCFVFLNLSCPHPVFESDKTRDYLDSELDVR